MTLKKFRNLKPEEQTHEICIELFKHYWDALKYVKEQTYEICLEAVKQNGCALLHVEEQTYEICLEAVKQYGYSILHVKEPYKRWLSEFRELSFEQYSDKYPEYLL